MGQNSLIWSNSQLSNSLSSCTANRAVADLNQFGKHRLLMFFMKTLPVKISGAQLSAICHFSIFSCLNTGSSRSCSMTSSLQWRKWWQQQPVADGRTTRPLPPVGLYVTLYKAFLSAGQAWCVYTALGAYSWHWLLELCWRFRARVANRSEREEQWGAGVPYWTSGLCAVDSGLDSAACSFFHASGTCID